MSEIELNFSEYDEVCVFGLQDPLSSDACLVILAHDLFVCVLTCITLYVFYPYCRCLFLSLFYVCVCHT